MARSSNSSRPSTSAASLRRSRRVFQIARNGTVLILIATVLGILYFSVDIIANSKSHTPIVGPRIPPEWKMFEPGTGDDEDTLPATRVDKMHPIADSIHVPYAESDPEPVVVEQTSSKLDCPDAAVITERILEQQKDHCQTGSPLIFRSLEKEPILLIDENVDQVYLNSQCVDWATIPCNRTTEAELCEYLALSLLPRLCIPLSYVKRLLEANAFPDVLLVASDKGQSSVQGFKAQVDIPDWTMFLSRRTVSADSCRRVDLAAAPLIFIKQSLYRTLWYPFPGFPKSLNSTILDIQVSARKQGAQSALCVIREGQMPTRSSHLNVTDASDHTPVSVSAPLRPFTFTQDDWIHALNQSSIKKVVDQDHGTSRLYGCLVHHYGCCNAKNPTFPRDCRGVVPVTYADTVYNDTWLAQPPCCRYKLDRMLKFMHQVLTAANLSYVLYTGSLLGWRRCGKTNPFDYDHDIAMNNTNKLQLWSLRETFKRYGYKLEKHWLDRWKPEDPRWTDRMTLVESFNPYHRLALDIFPLSVGKLTMNTTTVLFNNDFPVHVPIESEINPWLDEYYGDNWPVEEALTSEVKKGGINLYFRRPFYANRSCIFP